MILLQGSLCLCRQLFCPKELTSRGRREAPFGDSGHSHVLPDAGVLAALQVHLDVLAPLPVHTKQQEPQVQDGDMAVRTRAHPPGWCPAPSVGRLWNGFPISCPNSL